MTDVDEVMGRRVREGDELGFVGVVDRGERVEGFVGVTERGGVVKALWRGEAVEGTERDTGVDSLLMVLGLIVAAVFGGVPLRNGVERADEGVARVLGDDGDVPCRDELGEERERYDEERVSDDDDEDNAVFLGSAMRGLIPERGTINPCMGGHLKYAMEATVPLCRPSGLSR